MSPQRSYVLSFYSGPLAQSVEQRTFNPWVVGSIPTGPTRRKEYEVRVFVDVGAHFGESLVEVLKPNYGFNRIICIEPSYIAQKKLAKFKDKRIEIERWGAWDQEEMAVLHSAGSIGASLYSDKPKSSANVEYIRLKSIKKYFDSEFNESHEVFLKVNVEGAEYAILNSLFQKSSPRWRINSVLLSLDIRKVPSLRHYEKELLNMLKKRKITYFHRENADPATSIRIWLKKVGVQEKTSHFYPWARYFASVPIWYLIRIAIKNFVPKNLWLFLALKFGPNRIKN